MEDSQPRNNAGVLYARPGPAALGLLEETAWRIQLFQFHPEIVPKLVPFARPPYYANSDDQTLLNDCIVSAVLAAAAPSGNRTFRTFLGSTARFEAKNKFVKGKWSRTSSAHIIGSRVACVRLAQVWVFGS